MNQQQFLGVLNIHKPAGITSRKVVDRVVELVKPTKAGHAGTLDPLATGVLLVCLGSATRLIPLLQQQNKEYRAQFQLGRRSNTDDVTGKITEVTAAQTVTLEQIEDLLPRFVGRIEQVPPQFSAVHVDGKRAYELARRGQHVNLKPRIVTVHRIDLIHFEYPEITLEVECGSGTYIRSIGRDLGECLGCGAVMSQLVRTRIGSFSLKTSTQLDRLDRDLLTQVLLPATTIVEHLPQLQCGPAELDDIRCGRPIEYHEESRCEDGELVAVLAPDGQLACVARFRKPDRLLHPKHVFLG